MTHHLELLSQSDHRLFSVGYELFQVLISQLLPSTALPRTLPASFCNGRKNSEGKKVKEDAYRRLIREIDNAQSDHSSTDRRDTTRPISKFRSNLRA